MASLGERVRRNLLDARGFRELSTDWLWKIGPPHRTSFPITWPLTAEDRAAMTLEWPRVYNWNMTRAWVDNLHRGLRRTVSTRLADIPQPHGGVVLFRVRLDGRNRDVTLDYGDNLDDINREALRGSLAYFKMQYRRGGYDDARIIPGGYVNYFDAVYRYLPRLRRIKDTTPPSSDVYGRFGLAFASDIRKRAVTMLKEQTAFGFAGSTGTVRPGQSLREIARTKIAIDLPSNSDFTFRLVDYLSIGACVIGPPHRTVFPVPLVDREHVVFCDPDLSDLLPLCRRYLEDEAERRRVTTAAREYFDRFLHRDQLASYYLSEILRLMRA
jgi:hypothetical protein